MFPSPKGDIRVIPKPQHVNQMDIIRHLNSLLFQINIRLCSHQVCFRSARIHTPHQLAATNPLQCLHWHTCPPVQLSVNSWQKPVYIEGKTDQISGESNTNPGTAWIVLYRRKASGCRALRAGRLLLHSMTCHVYIVACCQHSWRYMLAI